MTNTAFNDFTLLDSNGRHQEGVLRKFPKIIVVDIGYYQMAVPRHLLDLEGVLAGF